MFYPNRTFKSALAASSQPKLDSMVGGGAQGQQKIYSIYGVFN